MVYFIMKPDNMIKIGVARRLSVRLKQLAAEFGDGLEVLGIIEGSFRLERKLHRRFRRLRVAGEWFKAGDDLVEFVAKEAIPWDEVDEAREPPGDFISLRCLDDDCKQHNVRINANECDVHAAYSHMRNLIKKRRHWDREIRRFHDLFSKAIGEKFLEYFPSDSLDT